VSGPEGKAYHSILPSKKICNGKSSATRARVVAGCQPTGWVQACWNSVSVLGTSGFREETMIARTQEMMIRQGQEVVSVLAVRLSDHFREVVAV
jgi:hypothetical protein